MALIKVGQVIINTDRVACIRDLSDRDTSGQVTRGLFRIEFTDDHWIDIATCYEQLSQWIASNATILAATP
ncbi:MAG: hypothetical protein ABI353_18820 [Isosphaeraceae bacterium]